jgi:hypothetical protein
MVSVERAPTERLQAIAPRGKLTQQRRVKRLWPLPSKRSPMKYDQPSFDLWPRFSFLNSLIVSRT